MRIYSSDAMAVPDTMTDSGTRTGDVRAASMSRPNNPYPQGRGCLSSRCTNLDRFASR